jgi:hypothetical protein
MLIITNGSSAAEAISEVAGDAAVLPWNDVLHDGPVPALDQTDLSEVRAEFLQSFAPGRAVLAEFQERDRNLQQFRDHDEVVLLFEHDLYDVLQLCQLLHFFHGQRLAKTKLSIAHNNVFLGETTGVDLSELFEARGLVTTSQLETGARFWQIFTSTDHAAFLEDDWSAVSFLDTNVIRLLEEYPSTVTGLGRSRQQIVALLNSRMMDPVSLFSEHSKMEEAKYLGDASFWSYIKELEQCRKPLVSCSPDKFHGPDSGTQFRDQRLDLTDTGRAVASGEQDAILMNGIHQWIGGVRLTPCLDRIPRWDSASRTLV